MHQRRWLLQAFSEFQETFQAEYGRIPLAREWADFLGINPVSLSQWMKETRPIPQDKAVLVCEKIGDWSLLPLLGYPLPVSRTLPVDVLPPALGRRLQAALLEISETFKNRAIHPDSLEAERISEEILQKFGFTVSSNTNDG